MSNVTVYMRDDYVKKNGESSIYLRLYVAKRKIDLPTDVSVLPAFWDPETKTVKKSHPDSEELNLLIGQCVARINRIKVRFKLMEQSLTPSQLKEEFRNPTSYVDFLDWMFTEIKSRIKELDYETIKMHFTVYNSLKEFRNNILFADIDERFIEKFDHFMRTTQSNNVTTRNKKLRVFKSYLNRALRRKIIQYNPFQTMSIKQGESRMVYLTKDELKKVIKLYKQQSLLPHIRQTLSYFLFACFTGLRISDVKKLSWDMIIESVIHNRPKKGRRTSNKIVYIPLSKQAKSIIDADLADFRKGLVFKTFSDQRTNLNLKEAMILCGVQKNISFHVARHTFATLFLEETDDLATLQQLLGHSSIAQTMVYAHVTERKKKNQVNRFSELMPRV